MRILLIALLLAACAPSSDDRTARPSSGPTISIGGGLGTYYGSGSR